jgi:DNA replication protein DnaC
MMLLEQTIERLRALRLGAMADKLREWSSNPKAQGLPPADLVGLLADTEWTQRENRRLTGRLRGARLRINDACVEDLTYGGERGLSKALMKPLMSCRWSTAHEHVIITGNTGVGKSYVACALGNQACRSGSITCHGGALFQGPPPGGGGRPRSRSRHSVTFADDAK